ncbi:MAG: LptF/LptG family permease [Rhodomicrobium sp.]|nr:LptF/LptG family permease [Rhodomicrobium sp.]
MRMFEGVFTFYVGRQFLIRFIGLLAFFVIILQMLDLLNESTEILAAEGSSWRSVARYISLRSPQIASQFAPFAALLAVVVTLSLLNIRSEITVMRAAGLSAHRVLFPIGFACGLIAVAHFIFQETVAVPATESLAYWEATTTPSMRRPIRGRARMCASPTTMSSFMRKARRGPGTRCASTRSPSTRSTAADSSGPRRKRTMRGSRTARGASSTCGPTVSTRSRSRGRRASHGRRGWTPSCCSRSRSIRIARRCPSCFERSDSFAPTAPTRARRRRSFLSRFSKPIGDGS